MNRTVDKLSTMAKLFQYWLDWQEQQYFDDGIVPDDNTPFEQPPVFPTRGTIKAWIDALEEGKQHLEEPND